MEKVIAVVVSYNRQVLLSECITALRNQTRKPDAILVINNGSTDNTEAWLKTQKDIFFITQSNIGSGGGFHTGITWAYENGYSWVWCMDDDGYPKEDALEKLLVHDTHVRSLLNCAVINKEDKKSFVWNTGNYATLDDVKSPVVKGIAHPFNGTLIHRAIIEKVGLPKSSLFLWGDESEYLYRITRKYKFPVYTITDSIHYHPAANFKYSQDWDYKSQWKMYYYIRNRFEINKAKFSTKMYAFCHYIFFLAAMIGIIMVFQKTNKIQKLSFLAWPVADVITNNYNTTPSSVLRRIASPRKTFSLNILSGIKSLVFRAAHSASIHTIPGAQNLERA